VKIIRTNYWGVAPFSETALDKYQCFGVIFCLPIQGSILRVNVVKMRQPTVYQKGSYTFLKTGGDAVVSSEI
jgi:hypothetical protein